MSALIALWMTWIAATAPATVPDPRASAELVVVEGVGPLSLEGFDCVATPRSREVARVCHAPARALAIAEIHGRLQAWCGVDAELVREWLAAPSMGRFVAERVAPAHRCD